MTEKEKDTLSQIPALIPELYFDIICRITPGVAFIAAICWLTSIDIELAWPSLLVGLFFAYLAGMILDSFANRVTSWLCIPYSDKVFRKYAEKHIDRIRKDLKTSDPPEQTKMFLEAVREYVRKDPSARTVLQKLIAEERLMKNAAVGLLLLLPLVLLYFGLLPGDCLRKILRIVTAFTLFLAAETILILAAMERVERTIVRTFYLWRHLIDKPEGKEKGQLTATEPAGDVPTHDSGQ